MYSCDSQVMLFDTTKSTLHMNLILQWSKIFVMRNMKY